MAIEVRGPELASDRLPLITEPGRIVHANGKVAIVAILKEREPNRTPPLWLASFDPETSAFVISSYENQVVLGFGEGAVIEPDLSVPSEQGSPGAASTTECYFRGEAFFIPLRVPASPDQRAILNLNTGEISPAWTGQAHVFKRWRLGVQHDGRVTWVLAIGTALCPWAFDVR